MGEKMIVPVAEKENLAQNLNLTRDPTKAKGLKARRVDVKAREPGVFRPLNVQNDVDEV